MNYYEELGVSRTAATEEIRRAYKELARVLHPDQHQEEGLRQAAERQMKRLNQVVAVLSDPEERRRYDLRLAGGPLVRLAAGRVLAVRAGEVARRAWVWLAAAGVAVAGLGYYFTGQAGGAAAPSVRRTEAAGPVAAQAEAEPRAARVAKNSPQGAPEAGKPRAQREETVLEPAPEVAVAASAWPLPVADPPPAPPAPVAVTNGLAGVWLYVPPRAPEGQQWMYPPEYIELRLIEGAGVLYGRYRARYRVTDRTLWPEVSFEFDGQRQEENFAWRGMEGARGEVRLKPVGPDRLEVTWWASELGERLSLASGTAVLVREAASAKEVQ